MTVYDGLRVTAKGPKVKGSERGQGDSALRNVPRDSGAILMIVFIALGKARSPGRAVTYRRPMLGHELL